MRAKTLPVFLVVLLLFSACDWLDNSAGGTAPAQTPTATVQVETPAPQETPNFVAPVTNTNPITTLTIWAPPDTFAPTDATVTVLSEQLRTFADTHSGLQIQLEPKALEGQGGILSYLRTGRSVAPAILPDLAILPASRLATAAAEELVYPLDTLLDPALLDDLYPAAETMVRIEDQIVGYPFALTGLPHLAYNRNVITTTLPLTWGELISTTTRGGLIFPAAGNPGANLALQFYLEAGGSLVDDAGKPILQVAPLEVALERISWARSSGFILPQSSNVATFDEAWQLFQNSSAALVHTTADQFIRQGFVEAVPGFAPIPGIDTPLTPLVRGWALVISTPDPARQELAAELLASLVDEAQLANWSYQSGFLPARRTAFALWPPNDPYLTFLQQELERAQLYPVNAGNNLLSVLGDAVFNVVSLTRPPQQAAEEAVAAFAP